ncbi:vacuolar protein sorting-associated protein 13 [Pluteus cervinus]|uniref:Vacuolar protein sorting-associated protein 13 n=1 Tax=Pluteus cervinus TaxID=181527 RepID=A0ACD3BHH1_9AGAR|nr:vacuolar protein sorting-associated protein 13 [Pluteus cervinus]
MWWLDPGKEVLNIIFNRILAPYIENLDLNQVNYGIGQGRITLRNLRLKKGALDKFQLPIDVREGFLGTFTLSLHWMNLGNQPVEVIIEDVYILAVPSARSNVDPEEEASRMHAAKMEGLENAELLHVRDQMPVEDNSPKAQGLWESLIAKIVNNVQITVKNIHIRYEDSISVPGHPFAAGITLLSFSAVSVNEQWQPAFIESTSGAVHKLARLQSLAIYFDTDSTSMTGLPREAVYKNFVSMISREDSPTTHQFILKPVSGDGRVTINHKMDSQTPRFDAQLLFNEISVALDDHQYRDVISFVDMYHVYLRQRQYRQFRPLLEDHSIPPAKSRLMFAGQAILEGVRQRRRQWSWPYFAERRDDRNAYVSLFQKRLKNQLDPADNSKIEALERKLSYDDLRFYRSIARSRLKKDLAAQKASTAAIAQRPKAQGWVSWAWGSTEEKTSLDSTLQGEMTEEQRKELYDVLDYDEKAALIESLSTAPDFLKARLSAKLNKGTFAIRNRHTDTISDILSVVFDALQADVIQRPDNFEASISLVDLGVFDGTTTGTLHPKIVHVKDYLPAVIGSTVEPFFFAKFENNPLDKRADTALTVRMRHMEIIYHRGYVEAIYHFFQPPESQLESVEALLNVASQTIEGFRKETRAGLEYALQTHKTVDIQLDMNAPVIIIPEDVRTYNCKHLVVDAGHISIESNLVDKEAVRTIHAKRNKKYTEEDYKQLESLMYDRFSLKLNAAQFILGDNYEACIEALSSTEKTGLHLLERTSLDFELQNSIVPTAYNLARFKVSGNLPTLQVNFSDSKYKAIMRLLDIALPKLGDDKPPKPLPQSAKNPQGFILPAPFFGPSNSEYTVHNENGSNDSEGDDDGAGDEFFEAEDGSNDQHPAIHQHIIEFNFKVNTLTANLFRSDGVGEKLLGALSLDGFGLLYITTKFTMQADVALRSLSMTLEQAGKKPIQFLSSIDTDIPDNSADDLLRVKYRRVQVESPDFLAKYEGIDQAADIQLSTIILRAAPEPLLFIYDFIMATFASEARSAQPPNGTSSSGTVNSASTGQTNTGGKIRVLLKLAGVQVTLLRDEVNLVTVLLSTADFALLLRPKTMRVTGRLGGLSVSNDAFPTKPAFKEILSIEGSSLADFTYQTFDPDEDSYTGIQSAVTLHAASVKLNFLEEPLQAVYLFFLQFARLKGLYDAATRAAVESAPEISRMQFTISIKSPIVCFPVDPLNSDDTFILRLGEMTAQNEPQALVNKTQASLHGIQLVSNIIQNGASSTLRIIEDIDVETEVNQRMTSVNAKPTEPAIQVAVNVTDVRLSLTQLQYQLLLVLAQTIPRVFSVSSPEVPGEAAIIRRATMQEPSMSGPSSSPLSSPLATVNLEPELIVDSAMLPNGTNIDLLVKIPAINLQLYDGAATEETLKEHGIVRFGLTDNILRLKMLFDGSMEAQVVLRSFTINNLRPKPSRFKELIPAATHERNQFMLLYTATGGPSSTSLAILTVDSPQVLLTLDPFVALVNFVMNTGFETQDQTSPSAQSTNGNDQSSQRRLDFRIDLHDVSVTILQDDNNPDSQAIRLSIDKLLLSQQGITALTISRLGMSLLRMGAAAESLRFLDEVDLTFSLDQRSTSAQQLMNVEVTAKPIIFRASYRDVNLITSIVNKAMELYTDAQRESLATQRQVRALPLTSGHVPPQVAFIDQPQPTGTARVLLSKEQLKGTFEGFRLVLIGDLHEQPLFHLKVMPFIISAKDWSGELSAKTTFAIQTSYWNMTNSHWEPLIDPWTFTASVSRENPTEGTKIVLDARERLDMNISTTFIELFLMNLRVLSSEGQVLQKARGTYAPYRIRNLTGLPVMLWNDSSDTRDQESTISPGQSLDWRFDDWKTLREHLASSVQHSIGVQFVGKGWEPLRGVTVDREGEFVFALRPRNEKYPDKLLCEIKVVDSVKVVTLRSTYKIQNETLYTLEVMLIDNLGRPTDSIQKVLPGQDFSLPIEAVSQGRIRLQPDQGFGYRWCSPIRREDLIAKQSFTIKCLHSDPKEAAFRFRVSVHTNNATRAYSKLCLKLRAPLELENLLPYNIEYRIYDKDTDQNWRSFLRKGGIMPVHSIELDHFVLLNVAVQDTVFRPSDFAIINNDGQGEFDIENRLVLQDESNRKLNINLNYVRYTDAGGAFKVQIYSPFVVINKTGLPFSVKTTRSTRPGSQDVAGDTRLSALTAPTPFLLSHPHPKGHEFLFKLGDSLWSKPCSVEAISAESTLTMASAKNRGEEIQAGLSWSEGSGKYKLTKVITLTPRFILVNKLAEAISFREHGVAPRDNSTVGPGQRCPLHLFKSGQERLLTIAFPGLNAQWSAPVNIENIGLVHLRLRFVGPGPEIRLIRINIKVDASTMFIYLEDAIEGWPFLIENDSDAHVEFGQTDASDDKQSTKGNPLYALRPQTAEPYAWDFPAAREKKLLLIVKGSRRVMDVMEIGSLPPFRFQDGQRIKTLSLDVRADGHRQTLRISNYNSERSVYRPRERSYSGTLTRQDTVNTLNSGEVFEAVSVDYPMIFTFNLKLAGIGLSLINRKMVEVVYVSVTDLKLDYFDNPLSQAINISFGTLQVDNQLHEAIYPVIVQPTPIPKDRSDVAALPTIQASVTWLKDQAHGVFFVKYCSLLLQALTIEADEDLLYSLYDLTQIKGAFWEADATDYLTQHPTDVAEPKDTTTGSTLYFEVFELQPIMLSLSFMTTERVSSGEPLSLHNPLAVVVNALTMTLGNVNDAPLELNALAIKDMRLTMPDLQSRIIYHYRQDVIRQLYRILGSADFIGNPVGLFTNVSSGVADIFYEPYNGVVMHGNRELGIGFAKGAASFLKKTVFGLSDSVTKFTSSVGKGLSAATFDSEYQARRRLNQRRNRPRHAIYGVTAGGEALASSVTSAVEGVLMKPIEGAEAEGAFGFFKGVGKGLVGAVTKPVVGVFDLASNVSEGIRNTTTVFDSPERERVRLPRLIPSDGVLKSYSGRESMGQYWMKDLDNGTYRSEFYIAHINSPGSDNVILLTTSRVLSFWSKKLRIEWDLPFTHVQGVSVEDTGIRFAHKNGSDQDKFALIPDKEAQTWFFSQVAAVVKAFNARRRMDS